MEQEGRRKRKAPAEPQDQDQGHGAGSGPNLANGAPVHTAPSTTAGPATLYLDSIDRTRLDFDFERLCVVSLSHINVNACLPSPL